MTWASILGLIVGFAFGAIYQSTNDNKEMQELRLDVEWLADQRYKLQKAVKELVDERVDNEVRTQLRGRLVQ